MSAVVSEDVPLFEPNRPLHTMLRFYTAKRWHLGAALGVEMVKLALFASMPVFAANVVTVITDPGHHQLRELLVNCAMLLVIVVENHPMHRLYMRYLSSATRGMEKNLRAALTRQLQYLSIHFYHGRDIGALQTKVLRDVEMVQQTTHQFFDTIPSVVVTLLVALVVTALRVPAFLLFYALTVPVVTALILRTRQQLQGRNHLFRNDIEAVSTQITEMLQLIPLTRAHGTEGEALRRVEGSLDHLQTSGRQLDSVNALFAASSWSTLRLFDTLCLVVAGTLAYTRWIPVTVADVVLLTGFFRTITDSVIVILATVPQLTKGIESFASLGEILADNDLEQNEGKAPVTEVAGAFRFDQVTYCYPHSTQPSLVDVSLQVQPGEMVAFVGRSGSGKSTLINLLIGFLRPTKGRIFLDEHDMQEVDLRTYRQCVALVSQETVLFNGSIRDNILYGAPLTDEARYQYVLDAAQLRELVEQLPQGDATVIGSGGGRLSGGQRQRIAIARALIRDPQVLILDEATSALDVQSEALVQRALDALVLGRTTFVVAHRLETIERANHIVVLEDGRIVEQGEHAELLATAGPYARLHGTRS